LATTAFCDENGTGFSVAAKEASSLADSDVLLEVRGLKKHFGGLKAVDGVDLAVQRGETLGLIGPNGAGKTTFFNMVCGFYTPTEGTIRLNGQEIQGLPAHAVARKGIARTFQITKVFKDMTVQDNLLAAFALKQAPNLLSSLRRSHTRQNLEQVQAYLERVDIAAFAKVKAGDLSLGYMRRLEIARALALEPVLLMLDEPCAGLSKDATQDFVELVHKLRSDGTTIMLVEHNMAVATALCDQMTVLSYGVKIAEGTPQQVQNNQAVIDAYLGEAEEGE
jgi:branched-chain amino acid transport system ATP-binding protein